MIGPNLETGIAQRRNTKALCGGFRAPHPLDRTNIGLRLYPAEQFGRGAMRLVGLIIGVVGLLALFVVGTLWTIIMMTPACILIGIVVLFVIRADRKQAAMRDRLEREAQQQRSLNEKEYAAWRAAADEARRNNAKRREALRRFDRDRSK